MKKKLIIMMAVIAMLVGCESSTRYLNGTTTTDVRKGEVGVAMAEQEFEFVFQCTHLVNETHSPSVSVKASFHPNMAIWQVNEDSLFRLTTVYGNSAKVADGNPNRVSADDVKTAVQRILAKNQESLCAAAKAKSLPDLMSDPGLFKADELNAKFLTEKDRHFDINVSATKVVLPDDLLRSIALNGLKAKAALVVTPRAKAKPASPLQSPQSLICVPLCKDASS